MAALFRRLFFRSATNFQNKNLIEKIQKAKPQASIYAIIVGGATCFGSIIVFKKWQRLSLNLAIPFSTLKAASVNKSKEEEDQKDTPSNYREVRFRQFASVEYENNIYMTPQDFLESVTEENPRARIGRLKLNKSDVEYMLKQTPALNKGSDKLFRKLHDKGMISYTEYLFLLCVLTKPHSGFRIAFNMFDTDGNQIVDKKEFLVLEKVFGSNKKDSESEDDSGSGSGKSKSLNTEIPDTTILVHFFGKSGKNALKYKEFHRFMENLQSEVIELEFMEFSKGLNTISEVEFARILLRYTNLDRGDVEDCLARVLERMPNEKGITFTEFKKFCQFLNNLDDFAIAMKMYTYAQQPISQEEFQRAVKVCTDYTLSKHLVSTVFNIFDIDGDGHLSYKEFISIMKDRLHRGARSHLMHSQTGWDAYKTCVKNEMRTF